MPIKAFGKLKITVMKRIILPFLAVLLSFALHAQPRAQEGTSDFQKTTQPTAIIDLPYPQAVVEKALDDYMAKKGYKGSDSKGYRVFRGYKLNNNDSGNDLYYKIDRKDRRDKGTTTIYLVVGKNGEDIKARTGADNSSIAGAADLLNDMVGSIDAYNLEVQITAQDDIVKKAQKKYDGLVEDQKDYEKKIKNLQDKLEQNRKDQDKQQQEIKNQSDVMEALKAKRKV
jgi:hypothetical protein